MIIAIVLFVVASLDRFSKVVTLVRPETRSLIGTILEQYPSINSGGVLGIFFPRLLLILATVLVGFFFLWVAMREQHRVMRFAFLLIALGIFSNGYDRVVYGYVIDPFRLFSTLSFNLADVYIVGGIGVIVYAMVVSSNRLVDSKKIV